MFLKPVKVLFLSCVFILGTKQLFAQNIERPFENNPYSRYGLGELQNAINPAMKAMGSITAAYQDSFTINTDNPASYASIKYFTYEAGGEGRLRTIMSGDQKYQTGTAGLSYFNMAIPLRKIGGMVIGFRPETKVSYSLYDTLNTLIGPSSVSYTGTGGTNTFFVGAATSFKGFSLGANVGYMFGTIRQASWLKTESTSYDVNNSEFSRISNIGGMYVKLGGLYENNFSKDYTIRIGVQANLKQNVNSELNEYWISHPFYASDTTGADTSYAKKGVNQKITLPGSYAFGINLAKSDKWVLGINYKTTNWSQFNNPATKDSIGSNAYRMSIGGEYTPNAVNRFNYWQRVTYRLGFYYGKDFVQINNYQANYHAATFGFSLPFGRSEDRIYTSFEIGKIGDKSLGRLQQNFVRFSFGFSFKGKPRQPDGWFQKNKID